MEKNAKVARGNERFRTMRSCDLARGVEARFPIDPAGGRSERGQRRGLPVGFDDVATQESDVGMGFAQSGCRQRM